MEGTNAPNSQHASLPARPGLYERTATQFYANGSAARVNTDINIVQALRQQYPNMELTVVPMSQSGYTCDIVAWMSSCSEGGLTSSPEAKEFELKWRNFTPHVLRTDGDTGTLDDKIMFGKYSVFWRGEEFLVYIVDGRDGQACPMRQQYVLGAKKESLDLLIKAVMKSAMALDKELWVFDRGRWQKDKALFRSMMKADWDQVIMDPEVKKTLRQDVLQFFGAKAKYEKLSIPWKRGVIYYGTPGNGKTVTIKALAKEVYQLEESVPTLYVRALESMRGPEYSIKEIFMRARSRAPCLLIFEDLDSFVTEKVKSYFFNELDGIQDNDGVLIIGSTNYLERLDAGLAKRPSRFDRKFEFKKPDLNRRIQYCEHWRRKLKDNTEVQFPEALSSKIAAITHGFSFAYLQEAFVASLLVWQQREETVEVKAQGEGKTEPVGVADGDNEKGSADDDGVSDLPLWHRIQKAVETLRGEFDDDEGKEQSDSGKIEGKGKGDNKGGDGAE